MRLNVALLMATLMLSGTALAQSSGPSATGSPGPEQEADVTTTGQAQNANKKTGDSGPPIEKAARSAKEGSTVGAAGPQKPKARTEHYP